MRKRKQHVLRKKPRPPARLTPADPSLANPLHAYRAAFAEWGAVTGAVRNP